MAARFCNSVSNTRRSAARRGRRDRDRGAPPRAVGALPAGLTADAVAVVVHQRPLGGELAALREVAAHTDTRGVECLPHRDAPVLVDVGPGIGEGLDEVLGEDRVEALSYRIGRGDDDAARRGEMFEKRKARGGRVNEDERAGQRLEQGAPFGRRQVGSHQIELGLGAVERSVTDEHEQEEIARGHPRSQAIDRPADARGRGCVGGVTAVEERRHLPRVEPELLDQGDRRFLPPLRILRRVAVLAVGAGDDQGVALARSRSVGLSVSSIIGISTIVAGTLSAFGRPYRWCKRC